MLSSYQYLPYKHALVVNSNQVKNPSRPTDKPEQSLEYRKDLPVITVVLNEP